ncbi:hypothetical protein BTJ07_07850 [Lactobacillus delbrueckii subsp. bulgaricus]|nr:hypothetical protein [Lactobacillus delbrueckii subsp. bulgaricus]
MTKYKLAQLAEIKYGKDHKKLGKGSVPVYGTGGIMRYVNDFIYEGESVLIPRKGSLNNLFYVHGKFWTVDTIFWTKIDSKIVLPRYLYYYLSRIDLTSYNVGSAVPSLTISLLNELVLDIPPISVQKDVVNKLTAIENKIKINEQINDNLAETKSAIFNELFDSKLANGLNGKLQDITDLKTGKRPKSKFNQRDSKAIYPIIGATKVMGFTTDYLYDESVITIGRVGTHGVVQRYREPIWVSDNTFIFLSEHEDYLYELLSHRIKYSSLNVGSTQPLITQSDLKNVDIYVPTKQEFSIFEERTSALTKYQFKLNKQNSTLKALQNSLLDKYF